MKEDLPRGEFETLKRKVEDLQDELKRHRQVLETHKAALNVLYDRRKSINFIFKAHIVPNIIMLLSIALVWNYQGENEVYLIAIHSTVCFLMLIHTIRSYKNNSQK